MILYDIYIYIYIERERVVITIITPLAGQENPAPSASDVLKAITIIKYLCVLLVLVVLLSL